MELTYAEICVSGPVRTNNEDRVGFWEPDTAEARRDLGAIAVMADGVGGETAARSPAPWPSKACWMFSARRTLARIPARSSARLLIAPARPFMTTR